MNNLSRLYLTVAILFTSLLSTNSTIAQNTLNLAGLSASSPSRVAYSLRRLSSTYSGNLIRVRRSSDNNVAEIGFDGSGHLDTNALKTFVGAGNGFVSIWYDQSGNANNAEQSTNGSQPQIVSAGVILRTNSRPVVRFDGSTFIDGGSSAYSITNARTLNAVYNLQSGTPSHIIDRNVAGNPVYSIKGDNQGQIRNDAGTLINFGTSQSAPFTNTYTMIWDGSNNINMFKNGISDYSGSLSLPCTMDIMRIGRHFSSTSVSELNMWEVILFPSAISNGERLAMECNQQVYYSSIGIAGSRVLTTAIPTTLSASVAGGTWSSSNTGVATVNSSTGKVTGVAAGTAVISYNTAAGCAIPTTITVSTAANALHFNGTDDIVTIPNNSSLNISGNITIEAWINVSSTANSTQNVISKSNNINNNAYIFPRTDNNWNAIIGYLHIGGSWQTIAASYPMPAVGTWHHCAITYDGSRITLYIDGAVANFIFVSGALTTNTNALVMGSQPGYGEFFTGALDEARIWNVARTQAQIQADMNNDVAQQSGLVAYYRFNQGTASGTNTGLTAITDFSGNENCGTSSGFSLSGSTSNFVTGAIGGYTNVNVVSPITGTLSVCGGSTTTLSSSTSGGVWSSSNTSVATVAAGVVTGVAGGTATISYTKCGFAATAVVTVTPAPTVTSVSPNLANPGASVTITGTGFNTTPANNTVYFGATRATVTAASATSLTATIPTGATYKEVSVMNTGCPLTGFSQYPFIPTFNNSAFAPATVNFSTHVPFTAESQPRGVVVGDLDGDGKSDMVVANNLSNTISVYHNTSTSGAISSGSFAAGITFATDFAPYGVAIGDIDGDGKPDLAVTNRSSGNISVFRNTSSSGSITSGSFATAVTFSTGSVPSGIAIRDLDGDGKSDIVVANNSSGTISILRNTSSIGSITSGSFASHVTFTAGTLPIDVAIGDLDGDGKPDVAAINNSSATVSVYRNTSTTGSITSGSFASQVTFATGSGPLGLAIGDIDGDGKSEIVTANSGSNNLSVFQNTSTSGIINTGSFATAVTFSTSNVPLGLAIGDINGDGKPDIAMAGSASRVSVFRNTSTSGSITSASFASQIPFTSSANTTSVAIGDLDGDGLPDLAVANTTSNNVSVLRNNPLSPITGTAQVCVGSTTTMSNATTGGAWSSSNASIASVNPSTGIVTGVSGATATITYSGNASSSVDGNRVTTVVTVYALPTSFLGNNVLSTSITTTLSNASGGGTWSSANTGVATIGSSTGVVTGVAAGTSTITYSVIPGCSATTVVTVNTPANGLNFDGSNDRVVVSHSNGYDLSNKDFTIEFWAKRNGSGSNHFILAQGTTASSQGLHIGFRTSNTMTFAFFADDLDASSTFSDNNWHHWAFTFDNTSKAKIIYRDGISVASATAAGSFVGNGDHTLYIGDTYSGFNVFNGDLDELRIWNTVRSQSQIQNNMNCNVAQSGNLVAYYRFDQGTASGTNTGLTSLTDFSGNNSCGTLNGFALTGTTSNYVTGAVGNCNTLTMVNPITGTLTVCQALTTTLSSTTLGGVWSSSNNGVATVAAGVVTGVAAGTSTISYSKCGVTVTAVVTVVAQPAAITGNNLLSTAITTTLANTVSGGTWSSANTGVAIIGSSTGVVTGVAAGTSNITFTNGPSCFSTTVVTVNTPATGIHFDGTNDYISNTSGTNLPTGNSQYTIEAWIKPTSGVGGIVGWGNYGTNNQVNAFRLDGTNRLHNYWWFNDLTATVPSLTDGKWHHVAATFNGTTRSIYCDGVLYAQDNPVGHNVTVSNNLTIGRTWTSEYLPGSIDEVKIWNTGRTASQIIADMNCDVAQNPNLVVYYRLNEGVASGSNAANNSATDYSGNNNCGTLNGFALTGATSNYVTGAVGNCSTFNPVAAITGTFTVCQGLTTTLSNATSGGVWSSSNNSVATVAAGVVTGVAAGTANITYTRCGSFVTAVVTVNALPSYTLGINKAVCTGTPTSLTALQSPAGNAITFPGSGNNYISIPSATNNRLTSSNFSVSVWIRPTSSAHQLIFYHGLGCVNWSSWFLGIGGSENFVNAGKLFFGFRTANGSSSFEVASPSNVTTNVWTHVFATYDGTNLRLYLNGSLVATAAASGIPYNSFDNLSVGMDPGCGGRLHYNGSLDDLQLWNTTRSATDIANYYNQHVAAATTGIVGSWAFDEASGSTISDSSTSANNASIVGTLSRMIPTTAPIFGTPTSTFVWSPSASLSASTGTTVSATPTVTTTYTVTGTGANGCINTSNVTVSVNPLPTVSAGSNVAICNTFSTNLTATGAVTYSWSPATNLSATTGATVTANPSSTVTYTVTGTDGNGCVNTASKTVSVNPLPTVSAGSSVAICNGNSTSLTATGAVTYSWSPATGLSATTGATVTANPSTTITYTVTGTDGNSCSNTSSVTVTVNALPPVSAGPDVAICNTFSTNITATGAVDYTWSPATNLSATTGATVTANPTSTITYTVTGTDGNGCVNTAQKTVSVNPLPGVFSSSTPNCIGTTTTISSSPSGGTWSSSNTGVATIGLNSGILNNVSTGTSNITYQLPVTGCFRVSEVTVNPFPAAISTPSALCPTQTATLTSASLGGAWSSTNASVMSVNSTTGEITAVINNYSGVSYTFIHYTLPTGCAVSRMVTVNPVPAPIFGGTTALCLGESTTLTSGSSGHTWSSSTPAVATVTSGGVVNSVGPGTTTISYTNSSSCATVKVVTVNGPLPANTGTLSVCTGQTTTLSNTTPNGTWSSANNTIATVSTLTGVVSGLSGGTVNISYRIGTTCFSVSQVTVNSNVAPVGGTKTVCVGTTTTLTYPVSGGTWSSATPAVATIDLNSGVVSGIGLGTSEITYTVAAGCFKTAIVTVTALPAAITGTAIVCQGSATTLSNGSGTWSSSNSAIATVNSSGVVAGVSAGNANITFRAAATGCYVTQEVTVNPLPVLVSAAVCPAQTATLTATPSGGTWSISNPSTATVNTTTGELTGVVVSNTGISVAVVTYTSLSSCVRTAVVTVNPVPSVISGGIRSICISGTTTLSSSTSGATWSSSTPTVATISVAGLVTGVGSGTTTISYTNASGCTTTAVMTVSALPVVPAITGTQTVCRLSTTSLSNATPGGTWSSSNNIIATVNSSGVVTGVNAGTVVITYTLGSGCIAIATAVVTVNHIPSVTAISGTLSVCENATRTLSTISAGGVWSSSVPAVGSISATGIVTGITAGNTMISYTVTNGFGCAGRSTAEVTVNPAPVVAALTGTPNVCKDATTTLSSATGGGVWTSSTPAAGTVNSSGVVTGVNVGTTTISYSVTNGFGCVTRLTSVVTVNPLPVISSVSGIFTTCENVNLVLTSNIALGTWSSSNIAVATIDTFAGVLIPSSVGTTMVTYNVLSTGCSNTREITTIQAPAVIAGVTAMCPGGTSTLTTTPAGGTWTTSNSSVITVNSTTGEVGAVIVGYGTIALAGITYTIPNGCSRVAYPTVNPIPSPIYGGVTSICIGESTTFLSGSGGFTWSSSATGVATVSSGGVVTAQGAGVATISYTNSFGCANTRIVTVNAALSPNVGSSSICTGTTTTFTNAITGGTWTSSNVSKATVNLTTGLVTATNAGTTTLSYRVPSGCYVTNVVTVNTTPAVIGGTRSVCIGSTTLLGTTPSGGTWTSSNASIATIGSSSGGVSGVTNGTATMTYTVTGGCTRTAEVTVNALPAAITGTGVACAGGGTTALTNVSGTWTSSNTSIASVSYLGMVTGGAAGTAIITFRNSNNCATTREVTINPLPAPLVSPTGLCAGSTTTLTGTPSGGTWLSSNPSVFTINASTGELTAVIVNITSSSLAVVTYTLPTGCSRTGLITINQQPSPIYGGTGRVCTGSTLAQLSGTAGCTWSSATPAVATISPTGVVTGISEGNAVISYTSAAGCASQRVITVNTTPSPITGATSVVVGATTTLANATSGGTWSSSTLPRATIGSASGVVTGMSVGTSNITYMMPSGCFVTRVMNIASAKGVAGEVSEEAISEVKIYPNPTTGSFSVSTGIGGIISVYTIDGKVVLQQQVSSGISNVTLPNTLAAGFYTCNFTDVEGRVTVRRLVYEGK